VRGEVVGAAGGGVELGGVGETIEPRDHLEPTSEGAPVLSRRPSSQKEAGGVGGGGGGGGGGGSWGGWRCSADPS